MLVLFLSLSLSPSPSPSTWSVKQTGVTYSVTFFFPYNFSLSLSVCGCGQADTRRLIFGTSSFRFSFSFFFISWVEKNRETNKTRLLSSISPSSFSLSFISFFFLLLPPTHRIPPGLNQKRAWMVRRNKAKWKRKKKRQSHLSFYHHCELNSRAFICARVFVENCASFCVFSSPISYFAFSSSTLLAQCFRVFNLTVLFSNVLVLRTT